MSGLKAFSCVVVLCGAMANAAIAGPRIEARGELGRFWGEAVGGCSGWCNGSSCRRCNGWSRWWSCW